MSETENVQKSLNKGIIINVVYIVAFIAIAFVVKNKWPDSWYYWIPIVLAIGSVLTIGTLLMNKRMLSRISSLGKNVEQDD